jgi:hypothetical protein
MPCKVQNAEAPGLRLSSRLPTSRNRLKLDPPACWLCAMLQPAAERGTPFMQDTLTACRVRQQTGGGFSWLLHTRDAPSASESSSRFARTARIAPSQGKSTRPDSPGAQQFSSPGVQEQMGICGVCMFPSVGSAFFDVPKKIGDAASPATNVSELIQQFGITFRRTGGKCHACRDWSSDHYQVPAPKKLFPPAQSSRTAGRQNQWRHGSSGVTVDPTADDWIAVAFLT